jgi:hypothetical protein
VHLGKLLSGFGATCHKTFNTIFLNKAVVSQGESKRHRSRNGAGGRRRRYGHRCERAFELRGAMKAQPLGCNRYKRLHHQTKQKNVAMARKCLILLKKRSMRLRSR